MSKVSKNIAWETVKRLLLPIVFLAVFLYGYIYYKLKLSIGMSDVMNENILKNVKAASVILIAFFIYRFSQALLNWYEKNIAQKTLGKLDDELIPLARKALKIVVWVIALLTILPIYKVNVNALVAALGVGSLAIALAAQDTIANIISGFLIMVDRPFMVGDRIKIPSGEVVTVLDIGVRRSTFLSEDSAIIIVPNVDLSKSKIVNYSLRERHGK